MRGGPFSWMLIQKNRLVLCHSWFPFSPSHPLCPDKAPFSSPLTSLLVWIQFLGCAMSSVSSSPVGALLHGLDRQYVYIAGTAIVVCAVVATVLLLSFGKQKIDYNSGIFSYLKFIYATFLKPHERGDGQQDALESFYKAQVWTGAHYQLPKFC